MKTYKVIKKKIEYLPETLAENVKALMSHRGWSQPELSRRSGVSQKGISVYINLDHQSASVKYVDMIAQAFGLNAWCLLIPNISAMRLLNGKLSIKNKKGQQFKIRKTRKDYLQSTLSKNLKALLAHNEWSRFELAHRVDVSYRCINNYYQSVHNSARLIHIEQISQAFGVNAWCLLIPGVNAADLLNGQLSILVD